MMSALVSEMLKVLRRVKATSPDMAGHRFYVFILSKNEEYE